SSGIRQDSAGYRGGELFIDLLEMLEAKTKGNLSQEESALLKQTLMTLRMSFVEAVEARPERAEEPKKEEGPSKRAEQPAEPAKSSISSSGAAQEEEHRTKFSKKY